MAAADHDLALVLSGGGARAAYQVGFLRSLSRHYPDLQIPILTGVSAGAINAVFLAAHPGNFAEAVGDLADLWRGLTLEEVFYVDTWHLLSSVLKWGACLVCGGARRTPRVMGLVDTTPLHRFLSRRLTPEGRGLRGIGENLRRGRLKALAITGTNYGTGQAVSWVQGGVFDRWERPYRRSVQTEIAVKHIMASAALPLFFPAVEVDGAWFGDGGIRQAAPLAPALHLGAGRILAISTRYRNSVQEADVPVVHGYPPPAQIIGTLMNSVFLDVLDQDAHSLQQINDLLLRIPSTAEEGPKPVRLFMLRPSCDIGQLAGQFESGLPGTFRFLHRGLGTHKTKSPDWLSIVLFEGRYLERLMAIGEVDAEKRLEEIAPLLP